VRVARQTIELCDNQRCAMQSAQRQSFVELRPVVRLLAGLDL
jgi:hypothetical protein